MNIKSMAMGLSLFAASLTAFATTVPSKEQAFLATHGLNGKTVVQMVDYIDQLPQKRPLPYAASITSQELKLSDGQNTYTYPVVDAFYLSFAPYISQTHPCFNHSLSGCMAELTNKTFEVTIKDASGKIILEDQLTSHANGFVGVWLPQNISNGTIEVKYNGLVASNTFSTLADSQTCMTTLQLKKQP